MDTLNTSNLTSVLTVYKASAGSGKTFTLAVQYIKLLVEADGGSEYAHILAVTFTNKATTEMKDRIIGQLYGIGHSLPASQPYYHELVKALKKDGRTDLDEAEIRRRCRRSLHEILHDYNRFRVSTIDAFFQSVMRGLAHELGLTANLQVDISDTEVLSAAVDRIVDRLQDDPVLLEWVYSLVRDQIENNQRWDVTGKIKTFGRAIFNADYMLDGDKLREVLSDETSFNKILKNIKEQRDTSVATIKAMGKELEQAVSEAGVAYTDFSNGKDLGNFVAKLQCGDMTVEVGQRLRSWANDSNTMVRKSDQRTKPQLLISARVVSDVLERVVEGYLRSQHTYNSAHLVLSHIKTLRLLGTIDAEVTQLNAERSRYTLAKTPILLHRMVGESDAPFVFEKMGALLNHVMIDEFQDTSNLQWMNFRALLLESYAKGGRNLIVGDVKQSIYRWRDGDWRLLGHIEQQFVPTPTIVPLTMNRRSRKVVVTFNNDFFVAARQLLDGISAEEISSLDEAFSFSEAYADVVQETPEEAKDEGYVRAVPLSSDKWQQEAISDMMEQIRQLHECGLGYDQMAILVRANDEALPIIDAFAAVEDMPHIVSDEAFKLSASSAVNSLIATLRAMNDSADDVAAYYVRQIGGGALLEDKSLLAMPLYELLETLYRRLHLDRIAHQEAYLFCFFDAVTDFIHSSYTSDIQTFLDYWDETLATKKIPSGQVDGIRILTIHKAKGLEFHTVFMPFCCWSFEMDRRTDLLWCHPEEAPYDSLQLLPVTPSSAMTNSAFAEAYTREHLFRRLDELNSLYVGFTRACANLYIWYAGQAESMGKVSRTVGDLIASIFPTGHEVGVPCCICEADKRSDNRMMPSCTAERVTMCNYPFAAVFRQSNRSQQFIQATEDDNEEEAMRESTRQQQYIETGRLLHSVLQQVQTEADLPRVLDALEHEGVIARYAADGTYVAVQRHSIEQWVERGMRNPLVSNWFSGNWHIFNECSIVRRHPKDGLLQTLRPDRVMRSADGTQIVVVDFKFGRPNSEHHEQVQTYMELLTAMYQDSEVSGYLWYVYTGKVQRVSPKAEAMPDKTETHLK